MRWCAALRRTWSPRCGRGAHPAALRLSPHDEDRDGRELAPRDARAAAHARIPGALVRTYSGALASYRDQTIEVRPLRMRPGDTEVTVRSLGRQAGAEPVPIEYDMERAANDWKVYDVRISGISLVANYRTSFGEEVRNHGIDGLIQVLAAKNRSAIKVSTRVAASRPSVSAPSLLLPLGTAVSRGVFYLPIKQECRFGPAQNDIGERRPLPGPASLSSLRLSCGARRRAAARRARRGACPALRDRRSAE